jgi:hypothetical protein
MVARLANNESLRARIHPVLGWDYGTGAVSETQHLNAQGLRGTREYGAKTHGLTRVSVFGDSYVYCNEVTDAESWPAKIEAGWKGEVLNYGVGGYGADQAYLRFREAAAQYEPDVVIMGFTPMMAERAVSRYRPAATTSGTIPRCLSTASTPARPPTAYLPVCGPRSGGDISITTESIDGER